MKLETITGKSNPLFTQIRKLQGSKAYRDETGLFVCEGRKMLDEAIKSGAEIHTLIAVEPPSLGLPDTVRKVVTSRQLLSGISQLETPRDIVFLCKKTEFQGQPRLGGALVLDGLQDPGNTGTILRTANALGIDTVFLTRGTADIYNPKCIRATMGAIFRQRTAYVSAERLSELKNAQNARLFAADISGEAVDISSVDLKDAAVAIGSEGGGLSWDVKAVCDSSLMIPMEGCVQSLNAAVAAAIVMWEMKRRP